LNKEMTMSGYDLNGRFAQHRLGPADRALVASGLWLRAGFVALCVEVIALIMLATGAAAPWIAITAAVVAGVIARGSWLRARAVLDADADTNGSSSSARVGPRPGRFGGPVELPLSR
jgi:hypothetical protein